MSYTNLKYQKSHTLQAARIQLHPTCTKHGKTIPLTQVLFVIITRQLDSVIVMVNYSATPCPLANYI